VLEDWGRGNITSVFKNDKKEDTGNCKLVNITTVAGKVVEQLILETLCGHMKNRKVTGSSQHGFTKGSHA